MANLELSPGTAPALVISSEFGVLGRGVALKNLVQNLGLATLDSAQQSQRARHIASIGGQ